MIKRITLVTLLVLAHAASAQPIPTGGMRQVTTDGSLQGYGTLLVPLKLRSMTDTGGLVNTLGYHGVTRAFGVGSSSDISWIQNSGDTRNVINPQVSSYLGDGTLVTNVSWGKVEYGSTITITTDNHFLNGAFPVSPRGDIWGNADTILGYTCANGGTACTAGGSHYQYTVNSSATGNSDVRNETWTFSVWARMESGGLPLNINIARYNDNEQQTSTCAIVSTAWTRCSITATWSNTSWADDSEVRAYIQNRSTTRVFLWGGQLEKVIGGQNLTPFVMYGSDDFANYPTFPAPLGGGFGGAYTPGGGPASDGVYGSNTQLTSLSVGNYFGTGLSPYFQVGAQGTVLINPRAAANALIVSENEASSDLALVSVGITAPIDATAAAHTEIAVLGSAAPTRSAGANTVTAIGGQFSATAAAGVTPVAIVASTGTSGATASATGTTVILSQAAGSHNYLSMRGDNNIGLSFDVPGSAQNGAVLYTSGHSLRLMTSQTMRQEIDTNGGIFFGDTTNTAIADNIDVVTAANTGTGQSTTDKALLKLTNSGSYTTAGGNVNYYGANIALSATESAGANTLTATGLRVNVTNGDTRIAGLFQTGTAPSGIVSASPNAVVVLEQQNGTSGYLQFRSNTLSGVAWANAGSATGGSVVYDSSNNAMQFGTSNAFRHTIFTDGREEIGDTGTTAVGDNVDVLTVGNTGTGQTGDAKSLIKATNTGSYTTAGGNINTYGINVTNSATESAGANILTNYAIVGQSTTGDDARGVYGNATGAGTNNWGVYGTAAGATTDIGVYGVQAGITATDWAIFADGRSKVNKAAGADLALTLTDSSAAQTINNAALLLVSETGTFNTTSGALEEFGASITQTSSRSSGANNLTNTGLKIDVSGAQVNNAIKVTAGDTSLVNTTVSGNLTVNSGSIVTIGSRIDFSGVNIRTTGTDPTLSACGTSPSIIGSDTAGVVTIGTGAATACTVTFSTAFPTNAPACTVTSQINASVPLYFSAISTSAFTVTTSTGGSIAGGKFDYICIGVP